jgi:competence CoiA-like predicted nuclease
MVGQGEGESDQHYNAKRELCEFLNRWGIEAFMEHPIPGRRQGWTRSADVGVPSLKLDFEIERGNAKYAEWRAEDLETQGWRVIRLPIKWR